MGYYRCRVGVQLVDAAILYANTFDLKLSGDEVHYTIFEILLVKVML